MVEARQRTLLNVDRRTGKDPLSISSLGDQRTLWASTGLIAQGVTKRLYLSSSGLVTAGSIFNSVPQVVVFLSRSTIVRADAIYDPQVSSNYTMVATWELIWLGPTRIWCVDVTNESGADADFLIRAEGL